MHRLAEGLHPEVVMLVHIDAEGRVAGLHVEHHGDEEFDTIARETVQRWRFLPARRGEEAVAVRVRVALHFEPPIIGEEPITSLPIVEGVDTAPSPEGEHPAHAHDADHAHEHPAVPEPVPDATPDEAADAEGGSFGAVAEIELRRLREEERGAGDTRIDREVLEIAPHSEGADLLRTLPGVYISRSEGEGVAHSIQLRGFNAEHGQDIEIQVGGIPINQPSHLHGQGYADLGFLIPEVVQSLRVIEGVSDPRQGDFAVAGSLDVDLGVRERGLRSRTEYGSFNAFRQMVLWAPEENEGSFAAAQIRRTDGFGQRRRALSASLMTRYAFGDGAWRYSLTAIGYGVRSELAGVVRRDDFESGALGFYDAYSAPTAQAQNAFASRAMFRFAAEHRAESGANSSLGIWFGYDAFRLQSNYTGFLERSTVNPDWVGRGDLIEQNNRTLGLGFDARHQTRGFENSWVKVHVEVGLALRLHGIEQAQRLIQAPQSQVWDERVDASIRGADLGLFGDVNITVKERVTLRVGARANGLFYDIDDRLGNRIPDFREETFIPGFRRSAAGVAAGPRTSLVVRAGNWRIMGGYGEGYRSPQARTLADGEGAPFTKVRSADVGLRYVEERVDLRASLFGAWLDDDVAFDPQEGRLERVGATRRLGATLSGVVKPTPWFIASTSLTYVDAELREPPPPSASDPSPPFVAGNNLPYVPPFVMRLDVGAHGTLTRIRRRELKGRAGVGLSVLSARPLPFGAFADPFAVLDASASLSFGPATLGLNVTNILGTEIAATETNFVSQWSPDTTASRLPSRHFAAAAPRAFLVSLELAL